MVNISSLAKRLRDLPPKRIILSGPSGFLGSRVLDCIINIHNDRIKHGLKPGEVVLLSAGPGKLMKNLVNRHGEDSMKFIRASRADYYTQHSAEVWRDHLGSLGLEGSDSVFINLAALAGPRADNRTAMVDVNYKAPVAAAKACESLGFGHWIQSSTFATFTERAAQVQYSRGKAMCDFSLCTMKELPVTIACLSLLYCKSDGVLGQDGDKLNLVDLANLPLTPILGSGTAPLQPQEVMDAAQRIAFLACSDPAIRPQGRRLRSQAASPRARFYDATGPQELSMLEVLEKFARYNGNRSFRPAHVDYKNMERMLNVASMGNLNRQFISLLRSEQQDSVKPVLGKPFVWEGLLGPDSSLITLDEAMALTELGYRERRSFPYYNTLKWIYQNPGVIVPGIMIFFEALLSFVRKGRAVLPPESK